MITRFMFVAATGSAPSSIRCLVPQSKDGDGAFSPPARQEGATSGFRRSEEGLGSGLFARLGRRLRLGLLRRSLGGRRRGPRSGSGGGGGGRLGGGLGRSRRLGGGLGRSRRLGGGLARSLGGGLGGC